MITVDNREGFSLRISRILSREPSQHVDIYFFLPGELGFSARVMSEGDFFHNAIYVKRTYHSTRHQLPLVYSRLASRSRLSPERYRLDLSLYAYQYVVALERQARALQSRNDASSEELLELSELCQGILRRLRRHQPGEERLEKYYFNIDNYLSWLTEQSVLALAMHVEQHEHAHEGRQALMDLAAQERRHREEKNYNSSRAMDNPSRMSNKMRLLRRLIEYPITLREKRQELGKMEEKGVKALAAGLVMVVVSVLMFEARSVLGDLTLRFFLALAVMYAAREVFKEDLRDTLWRWLRRGRPKWRSQYYDNFSGDMVARALEWFDYSRYQRLPDDIRRTRRGNMVKREEHVLHYRNHTMLSPGRFLKGYYHTREVIIVDLQFVARLMDPGSFDVYRLDDEGNIQRDEVEKRYQVNLVVKTRQGDDIELKRWKITMNRSRIVDIEAVGSP
ncbi:hypothetical protein [Larsenimonas rhizosphaerae]|uniref:hypothetical protein n=1 Tax=Larsenimonas rhizosphaerae TaxID=2944682 RepID=UPI00203491CF|nr:hypothetical protein [Larsenimonas rhizosphaerae]